MGIKSKQNIWLYKFYFKIRWKLTINFLKTLGKNYLLFFFYEQFKAEPHKK